MMATESQSCNVWLITGCSTGFGRELVLAALKRGDKVIATARSLDKIGDLAEAGAHTMKLDVTQPLPELEALAHDALQVYGRVDILVNNAGVFLQGAIEAASPEETQAQYDTNVFGLLNVTRAFLPHMRARGSGTVALIGSVAGHLAFAGSGLYASTKFAVEAIGEALHHELAPLGIAVTIIEPGYFRTPIIKSNALPVARHIADYDQTAGANLAFLHSCDGKHPGDTAKGAQRIVDVLTRSGSAAGRQELPLRLALGTDAYHRLKAKFEELLARLEEWKDLSFGTEHDDEPAHI